MNGWMTGWTNRSDTSRVKELPTPTRPHSPQQKLQHSASHLSETARGTKWPEARDTPHNANPVPASQRTPSPPSVSLRTMATGRIYNPHPHGGCSKSHSGSFGLISRHHDMPTASSCRIQEETIFAAGHQGKPSAATTRMGCI